MRLFAKPGNDDLNAARGIWNALVLTVIGALIIWAALALWEWLS